MSDSIPGPPPPSGVPPRGPAQGSVNAAASGTNPFAGIPVSDYVRDVLAAVLLFVSLALPWSFDQGASDRVEVILITVLSVLTLTVPYLARVGVFGTSWHVLRTRQVRLVGNAPYLVLLVVYLVRDVLARGSDEPFGGNLGGIGSAAALGLAGAVLAAQPRGAELGPIDLDARVGQRWSLALGVGAGVLAVGALVSAVLTFLDLSSMNTLSAGLAIIAVSEVLAVLAVGALPTFRASRLNPYWRVVLVGVAVTVAVVFLFAASSGNSLTSVESLSQVGFGLVLLPALAAVAASPAVVRTYRQVPPQQLWVGVAGTAFVLGAVVAGTRAFSFVGVLVLDLGYDTTQNVLLLVFSLLTAAAGVAGYTLLRRQGLGARVPVLAIVAVLLVLGTVIVIIASSADVTVVQWEDLLVAYGLPATIAWALLGPAAVRPERSWTSSTPEWAWNPAASTAYPRQEFPTPGPQDASPSTRTPERGSSPAQEAGVAASEFSGTPEVPKTTGSEEVGHSWTPAIAADPQTDGASLARIVTEAPELRPYVAANPSTYPDLLRWLADLHDPRVDAALQARPR